MRGGLIRFTAVRHRSVVLPVFKAPALHQTFAAATLATQDPNVIKPFAGVGAPMEDALFLMSAYALVDIVEALVKLMIGSVSDRTLVSMVADVLIQDPISTSASAPMASMAVLVNPPMMSVWCLTSVPMVVSVNLWDQDSSTVPVPWGTLGRRVETWWTTVWVSSARTEAPASMP